MTKVYFHRACFVKGFLFLQIRQQGIDDKEKNWFENNLVIELECAFFFQMRPDQVRLIPGIDR